MLLSAYLDIAAVFLPLFGAIAAGLLGHVVKDRAAQLITCLCMAFAAALSVFIFNDVAMLGNIHSETLGVWLESGELKANWGLRIDTLAAVMVLTVNFVSAMIHVYSIGYMEHDKGVPRFMAYMSLFTFFMLMLVTSDNLIQMFFGWEGVGLMSYLLINFWYEKPEANDASMKAFIVNRVGDFGFLLGIFGCFVLFGSVQFNEMFASVQQNQATEIYMLGYKVPALTAICLLLFMGAMGKSAQLGLHTWLPDAMEGPTPVSALIHAATMVTAGVFMVARLSPMFECAPDALAVVAIVGALTAVFAASIGLTQFDIKRVIAYSTMSQLGYMFFALGVSAYSAAIFHLVTHAFFKSLLFLGAGSVIHALSGEQDMRRMGGIWNKTPYTYAFMWVGSLALAGIGIEGVFGFSGFYSKDLILASAFTSGHWYATFVYIVGLIVVFMTALYSWRLIIMAFHGPSHASAVRESSWIMLAPLVPLAIGAIFSGWYADDWFAGEGSAGFWRNAIFILPSDSIHTVSVFDKILPSFLALSGIAFAYVLYMRKPLWPVKITKALGFVYRVVFKKYYFDEIYNAFFVTGAKRIGNLLWQVGDNSVIDGYGPDGLARLVQKLGRQASRVQTGYVYHYAFAMIVGLAAFIMWFGVRG